MGRGLPFRGAEVAIAVSGGGSGTGIAALINGTVDIANASRDIKPEEQQRSGSANVDAKEHTVAIDDVVFFVHKANPLPKLTIEQLACIYGEGGTCENWSSLGVEVPGCADQTIIRVSRQSNSGTYEYVRERVLGSDSDFKLGSRDMQGSKDVVDLVETHPVRDRLQRTWATRPGREGAVRRRQDAASRVCRAVRRDAPRSGKYPLSRPSSCTRSARPRAR